MFESKIYMGKNKIDLVKGIRAEVAKMNDELLAYIDSLEQMLQRAKNGEELSKVINFSMKRISSLQNDIKSLVSSGSTLLKNIKN